MRRGGWEVQVGLEGAGRLEYLAHEKGSPLLIA